MDKAAGGPIIFRGRAYASVDEMPARVRQAYERVLRMLDEMTPARAPDAWEEQVPDKGPPLPRPAAGAGQE